MLEGLEATLTLLAGLNRLLLWWSDLGFEPVSSGTRHIRLHVSLGGYSIPFEIVPAYCPEDAGKGSKSSVKLFELRFDIDARYTRQQSKPALTFSVFDSEVFVSTARLLIERREKGFRDWLKREHDHLVWERNQAVEQDRASKEAARRRTEAARKALLESRERAIDDALEGMKRADQLRSLISELQQRLPSAERNGQLVEGWKNWVLEKAHAMDIRTRSPDLLVEWIRDFRLSDEDFA